MTKHIVSRKLKVHQPSVHTTIQNVWTKFIILKITTRAYLIPAAVDVWKVRDGKCYDFLFVYAHHMFTGLLGTG